MGTTYLDVPGIKAELRRLLLQGLELPPVLATEIMERMDSLIDAAGTDEPFPLASSARFNGDALAKAVSDLTGLPVKGVAFLSRAALRQDGNTVPATFGISGLYDATALRFPPLGTTVPNPRAELRLYEELVSIMMRGLTRAVDAGFHSDNRSAATRAFATLQKDNLLQLMYAFVQAALREDRARMDRIQTVLMLQTTVPPLGFAPMRRGVRAFFLEA